VAELACGRPTVLASEPPDAGSLERVDWIGLVETVASGAGHERWRAIEILGELGEVRAVPALLGALADPRGTLRPCLAAQSLGRLGDPRAVDALIAAAGQRENEDLRLCAIKSLGLLRAEGAVPVLADAVQRGEMLVAASHALARIATPEGARAVVEAARDPERAPWVVDPLGEFGLPSVEAELRRLMGARDAGAWTQRPGGAARLGGLATRRRRLSKLGGRARGGARRPERAGPARRRGGTAAPRWAGGGEPPRSRGRTRRGGPASGGGPGPRGSRAESRPSRAGRRAGRSPAPCAAVAAVDPLARSRSLAPHRLGAVPSVLIARSGYALGAEDDGDRA
jgi:hypothetical protein